MLGRKHLVYQPCVNVLDASGIMENVAMRRRLALDGECDTWRMSLKDTNADRVPVQRTFRGRHNPTLDEDDVSTRAEILHILWGCRLPQPSRVSARLCHAKHAGCCVHNYTDRGQMPHHAIAHLVHGTLRHAHKQDLDRRDGHQRGRHVRRHYLHCCRTLQATS